MDMTVYALWGGGRRILLALTMLLTLELITCGFLGAKGIINTKLKHDTKSCLEIDGFPREITYLA
jgi:hypothetical protein